MVEAPHRFGEAVGANEVMTAVEEPILQFFKCDHLPADLARISEPFCEIARMMAGPEFYGLPRNPERTVALRKLLEAKDAAVRSVIFK